MEKAGRGTKTSMSISCITHARDCEYCFQFPVICLNLCSVFLFFMMHSQICFFNGLCQSRNEGQYRLSKYKFWFLEFQNAFGTFGTKCVGTMLLEPKMLLSVSPSFTIFLVCFSKITFIETLYANCKLTIFANFFKDFFF